MMRLRSMEKGNSTSKVNFKFKLSEFETKKVRDDECQAELMNCLNKQTKSNKAQIGSRRASYYLENACKR